MFDAMSIGAMGMQVQQIHVDTIANNVANASTPGYKKGRVSFTDLVVQGSAPTVQAAADGGPGGPLGDVGRTGIGVGISSLSKLFDLGSMQKTESPYDIAINGDGFFEITMPDGSRAYTRGGTLKVSRDGLLSTQAGLPLRPGIAIPDNAKSLSISADGLVQVTTSTQSTPVDAGQLEMVRFTNLSGLVAQGDGLFRTSESSGEPISARPGEGGMGLLAQGVLEGSNVKMVEEMVNLMVAQRAYEANVKIVQAADEMLGMINGLRK